LVTESRGLTTTLRGLTGKTSRKEEGKERQNLNEETAEGVSVNTSRKIVPNTAHYLSE
jgi:hypothetical protein